MLSAVDHRAGPYAGGVWLLSGVVEVEFRASERFAAAVASALLGASADPARVAAVAASWWEAGIAAQEAAAAAVSPALHPGPVRVRDGHLEHADGTRYFMLGGNLFRWFFPAAPPAEDLALALRSAAISGLNTVRFYGLRPLDLAPDTLEGSYPGSQSTHWRPSDEYRPTHASQPVRWVLGS